MKNVKSKRPATTSDLPESNDDKKHLQPDEGILDLPDVRDIPGQEHIHPPVLEGLADITISSDDEEGVGILDDVNEDEPGSGTDTNVSKEEKKVLTDAAEKMPTQDEDNLANAQLDQQDEDGDFLNERTDLSGSELDVPGSEQDDANEEIGEEDEENNAYSLDDEDEDNNTSK